MGFSDKQRQLLQVMADGQFHSGATLAVRLNLSRSAIWKHIQAFMALGIEVMAVSGKGYRLENPLNLLDINAIQAELTAAIQGKCLEIAVFDQCESTNNHLMAEARQGRVENKACLAEYQTAGKGRRGRHWVSPFGQNIMLSVLWRFESGTSAIAGLSLAIGVAVIRALKNQGIEDVGLKWPNDIFWQGKKLGGILIEVSGETNGPCAVVVGLGLNGYVPAKAAADINQEWVDLRQITGQTTLNRNRLVAALLNTLIPMLAEFEHTDLLPYLQEWRRYDCMLNQTVTVQLHNQALSGIVKGIDDDGLLLLQDGKGNLQAFSSAEISFNPQSA
jgi:BirA family transcriptional regulator, biotin operon repressor / biotin---[acetyl-CoA-carboxylase] ligase